jgi:subtilisin family serine protease
VDLAAPGVSIYSSVPEFSFGVPDTVYSENFNTDTGPLPDFGSSSYLLGWQKNDAVDSTWEVTEDTGKTGNSLEDSPFSADYFNNSAPWAGYMTPLNTEEKDYLYTFTFKWKGSLLSNDYLYMIYSVNGINWYAVDGINGTQNHFASYSTDVFTNIAEMYDSFYLGFGMTTNGSGVADGVYLDDIEVIRKKITVSNYDYTNYNGTSMAAPHVSGTAGLILALNSSLTNHQVKAIILNNVDQIVSVTNKVATDGRLNANNAVQDTASSDAPENLTASMVSGSQINLSWTDNSSDEDAFEVERKTGASGNFSVIATLEANVTTYSNTGLLPATTYYYRIHASGTSSGDFNYSNIDSATTLSSSSGGGGGGGGGGGPCFIATAAYGSILHPHVKALSDFRDRYLLNNFAGKAFVRQYYKYSPPAADFIKKHGSLRFITRVLLTPLVMLVVFPYTSLFLSALISITALFIFKRYRSRSEYC